MSERKQLLMQGLFTLHQWKQTIQQTEQRNRDLLLHEPWNKKK